MNPIGQAWTTPQARARTHRNAFAEHEPGLLGIGTVRAIAAKLEPWKFEPIYGAWWDRIIPTGGKPALAYSARRYIDAVSGPPREA